MSILIMGMKMPQNGFITITIGSGGTVVGNAQKIDNKYEDLDNKEIASAVSIPPHGRLIDADNLISAWRYVSKIEQNYKATPLNWSSAYSTFADLLDCAPTIIPADKEEK